MDCCRATENDRFFDARFVRRELKRYRKRGPGPSTRELLTAIEASSPPPGSTLLDVGGGVGGIHHRLLERGFAQATQIDASGAYLAADLPQADVVTLDRVVCCDSDYESMLGEAAAHARRLVAFTYPRPRFVTKVVVSGGNALPALLGRTFRTCVHPPERMAGVLERNGLRRRWAGGTFIWAAEVFER
jgi:magnesium-protoporphyrin O-methyltransferase